METHTTTYEVKFENATLQGQRDQYLYSWRLYFPTGSDCFSRPLTGVSGTGPWLRAWRHDGCTHDRPEWAQVRVERKAPPGESGPHVWLSGRALGPGRGTVIPDECVTSTPSAMCPY